MNPLEINKEYWQKRNPEIEFRRVKKAYYGTHLLKANIKFNGASVRYYSWARSPHNTDYCPNPNYDQFMSFLRRHTGRFNTQKILKTEEDRWLHVRQSVHLSFEKGFTRIYDVKALYALHLALKNVEPNCEVIRYSREGCRLRVYGNDINKIIETLDQLHIDDSNVLSITSPNECDIESLLSGKEFNPNADLFKYKIFLKACGRRSGIPDLANYLNSIKDTGEVKVPHHCDIALTCPENVWAWSTVSRSYLYARDMNTVLLIRMLAGDRFSGVIELIMPDANIDK